MNKKPDSYIATLETKRKRLRTTSIIIIFIYVVALVLVFFQIIIAAAVAQSILYFTFSCSAREKRILPCTTRQIPCSGWAEFDSIVYDGKGRLDYGEYRAAPFSRSTAGRRISSAETTQGHMEGHRVRDFRGQHALPLYRRKPARKVRVFGGTWIKRH